MKQYHDLLANVLQHGKEKDDRTGTGTLSVFGYQMRFNLRDGFPLLTTKKVHWKSVAHELLWFIAGDTNIRYLVQNGVSIWNDWPYQRYLKHHGQHKRKQGEWKHSMEGFVAAIKEDEQFAKDWGELGPVYGKQWRNFNGIDQLAKVIENIKANPNSRRHIVSAWNPAEVDDMALPPCHAMFQFYVNNGELSCHLYQRSADIFLGVPFNIASYALLTHLVAHECGLKVGEFVHTLGDAHLYKNHIQQAKVQLLREPTDLPTININPSVTSVFDVRFDDIELIGYNPQPAIKAEVAV